MILGPDGRFPDGSSPYEGNTDKEIMESMRAGRFKGGAKAVRIGGPSYFTGSKAGDDNLQDFLGGIGALGGMAKEDYDNRKLAEAEFYCPYCQLWINDTVHRQDFHNDLDDPDDRRDCRLRIDGEVYEDEADFRNRDGG
jgi:hypothetical protein